MASSKKINGTNYESAFWEAQSFLIAADVISKKAQVVIREELKENVFPEKSLGLQFAKDVNHAYAFELLLKCIMIIENSYYHSGHDLYGLFKLLDEETQKKLIIKYSEYQHRRRHRRYFGIWEDVGLTMVLEEAGRAFMEFRYLFEGKPTPPYDLDRALECLEWHIFTLKPELEKLKYQ